MMGAHKSYNNVIVGENDILMFWFQCKVCGEKWFSSFCLCPSCNKVNKFKILSGEQAIEAMKDSAELDHMYRMAIFGLLNKELS